MAKFDFLQAKLIIIDGPDWVGKTTQIKLVKNVLEEDGQTVYLCRASGGSPFGEALRNVSLSDIPRPTSADLYVHLAMYAASLPLVQYHRNIRDIIICDRGPCSIMAYQVFAGGLNKSIGLKYMKQVINDLKPELMINYQATWQILQTRANLDKTKKDYFESKSASYFKQVIKGYSEAAKLVKACVIDATNDIQAVHIETMKQIAKVLSVS